MLVPSGPMHGKSAEWSVHAEQSHVWISGVYSSSYGADDVRKAMGRKTASVRELLPRAADEVVHRDYLVLV